MKDNNLVANPNKIHCLLDTLIFAAAEAAGVLLYYFLKIDSPATNLEKGLQTAYVCGLIVLTLFMGTGVIFSLRSLYPRAILTVTDEKVLLEKKKEILLSDIESVSSNGGKKLVIKAKNGDVISIRKTDVNVPLETLEYAINLRIGKAEKQ